MSLKTNENQTGALEVAGYLAAIVLVIGSVMGGWNVNLPIALILMVAMYAVFRDIRTLTRVKTPPAPAPSPEQRVSPQEPSRKVSSRPGHRQISADQETERI